MAGKLIEASAWQRLLDRERESRRKTNKLRMPSLLLTLHIGHRGCGTVSFPQSGDSLPADEAVTLASYDHREKFTESGGGVAACPARGSSIETRVSRN